MSDLDLTEAVDAAARVLYELRHPPDDECPHIPWEDTYRVGWREDVLPLITAAAPFIAAQAAEAERGWWVRAVEQIWLGLGPTGRCESGQPLLDLLALDKRRGGGVMAFSGHLAFVMFVGAARADADPTQRDRLKAEIPPLLEEYVHPGSPETVLRQVVEIMGPQWRPTGEWATWIDGLTKREAAE